VNSERLVQLLAKWHVLRSLGLAGGVSILAMIMVTTSSCGSSAVSIVKSREVLLVPSVDVGWAGWCVVAVDPSFGGCPPGRSRPPILSESLSSGGFPRETVGYVVTTEQVAAVSLNGEPAIATEHDRALPDGLRSVGFEIRGKSLLEESQAVPHFTPLNRNGGTVHRSVSALALAAGQLGVEVPVRNLKNPETPSDGVCRIDAGRRSDLRVDGGGVIAHIVAHGGVIGQGFLSCASTSYTLDGWPLLAGVLLNASHPGLAPPPLAAMAPLRGHPGIVEAPGSEEGGMVARRIPGAWLVVARARLKERLSLLGDLRVELHLKT
jgi:hypothetical protein